MLRKEKRKGKKSRVNAGQSRGSPRQTEQRSRRRGALLGRRRHRRRQQQRGASNGRTVVGAILVSLYTFCFVVVDTLQLHTWSSSPSSHYQPSLLPSPSSPSQSTRRPHHFSSLQLCGQPGCCRNGCSSSRHTHMEIIHSHPTQNSSSATQPTRRNI